MSNGRFGNDEVGFSHPTLPIAFRLCDDGTVVVQAGDAAGMVLDSNTGRVTIYGTSINLIAPDLEVDGIPVDKESILKRVVGKVRRLFSEATPKFPSPKE